MLTPSRVAIGFSNISHTLTHMFMLLYPTAVLGLEAEFHLPYGELLSLSIAGFVLFGAAALPAGWLADKWSERWMLAVLLFGMGGSSIYTGTAETPLQVAIGLGAIGMFAAIYHPVGISMVVRHAVRRGRVLGLNGVFGGLGLASGAIVAGTLMDFSGWRSAFIVPGVVVIMIGVVYLLAVRISGLQDGHVDAAPQPEVSRQAMVWAFAVLAVTTMCAGLIFQATSVALPKIFAERLDFFADGSTAAVGGFVSLVYLVAAAFQIVGGYLADRFPLKWVYAVSYTIQVPVLLLAASLVQWPMVGAAMAMVLLQNGAAPAETALFTRYSPAQWRATALGIKFVLALGVSALGVMVVGRVFDATGGFYWLFLMMGGVAAVNALVALLLPNERPPAQFVPALAPAAGGGGD